MCQDYVKCYSKLHVDVTNKSIRKNVLCKNKCHHVLLLNVTHYGTIMRLVTLMEMT